MSNEHGEPDTEGTPIIVSYDGSVASAAVVPGGRYRVTAETNCHYAFAATAAVTDKFLPADTDREIKAPGGVKIAAIKESGGTAGKLYLVPLT